MHVETIQNLHLITESHNRLQNMYPKINSPRFFFVGRYVVALGTNALIHSHIYYLFELIYGDSKHHGWLAKRFSNRKKKTETIWSVGSVLRRHELCYSYFCIWFYLRYEFLQKSRVKNQFSLWNDCNFCITTISHKSLGIKAILSIILISVSLEQRFVNCGYWI